MNDVLKIFQQNTRQWFSRVIGTPTPVQNESWPTIAGGKHVLVTAPTGSGKTLAAFLVFVDRLKVLAARGSLREEIYLIYVSPLKALGNDIRENLRRPLDGIDGPQLNVAVRTGDTTQNERRKMLKKPPHILITTPESLYLLLTSKSGKEMLKTAHAVIIDELHAVINSKRGAHLLLSLARLDVLCGKNIQRVGLSATVQPLDKAAAYLAVEGKVTIVAPEMVKKMAVEVNSPLPDMRMLQEGTIWPELAKKVYEYSRAARTVIVFVEARNQSERLSYYINQLAGDGYARTHHGCVSKERRLEAEQELRSGQLKVLCATSSMELGIDVGEVDVVLQIGFPKSISSAMQRLGRAGHNPGRLSVMHMLPRTAGETLCCGLTAKLATAGQIEKIRPPQKCLDVLAQHLVSMAAAGEGYSVRDVMAILKKTYSFRMVTQEEVQRVLGMLAGDYEHMMDRPARPRVLYDRIHGLVEGDKYTSMLALSTGGTIPDKGFYPVRLSDGTKVGELEEEFVFEARVGDKFMLGSFAWRITELKKDKVMVSPATPEGAQPPFWRGEQNGRSYETGIAFGKLLGQLSEAYYGGNSVEFLKSLSMDEDAIFNTMYFLQRQMEATGILPDDKTILVEHFHDQAGESQMMVHSIFGRKVNAGLALLVKDVAQNETSQDIACYEEDDGFLVYPYGGGEELPYGLLQRIDPAGVQQKLSAVLPLTPLFNMAFRYNTGRALMMGARLGQRQPLWIQRLKSAEVLDGAIRFKDHPLVAETRRECLEDYWDIPGLTAVLEGIQNGTVHVKEIQLEEPSPMSLPFRRKLEAELMYDYTPTTSEVRHVVNEATAQMETGTMAPSPDILESAHQRKREPENKQQLHGLLMVEGDLIVGEADVPNQWFEALAKDGRACYIEPGLWICMEQESAYLEALEKGNRQEQRNIVRRCLRYRGAQNAESLSERYFWDPALCTELLNTLAAAGEAIQNGGWYYHRDVYRYAQNKTIQIRRKQVETMPFSCYAHLMGRKMKITATPAEQLKHTVTELIRLPFPVAYWENVIFPARVNGYKGDMLDLLLGQGEFYWQLTAGDKLCFYFHKDIDWSKEIAWEYELTKEEETVYAALKQRGASFGHSLAALIDTPVMDVLLSLCEKGMIHADSFVPVRHWLNRSKVKNAPAKQRAKSRAMAISTGRWEISRPELPGTMESELNRAFHHAVLLCRETASGLNWSQALETLRVWEYTGQVRRGYFIEGLSGAQYIREQDYASALEMMKDTKDILWLNGVDPAQVWGKTKPHIKERSFMNVSSTAVALQGGNPVAVMERQGKVLRIFEDSLAEDILNAFVKSYKGKRIFPQAKRITVSQYPGYCGEILEKAGFARQMLDFVLWQV